MIITDLCSWFQYDRNDLSAIAECSTLSYMTFTNYQSLFFLLRANGQNRTGDPILTMDVLYRLSYIGNNDWAGDEARTRDLSDLKSERSTTTGFAQSTSQDIFYSFVAWSDALKFELLSDSHTQWTL